MSQTILVPLDGSPLSRRALEYALETYDDASIVALHVLDPAEPGYSTATDVDVRTEPRHGSEAWYERADEEEQRVFEAARELAAEYDAKLSTETAVGNPAREIVDVANEHGVDHVVVGSHGRSETSRLLLGSVAESVVRRAPIGVTVVRTESDS